MDWILTDTDALSGTAYFEIVPGPYAHKHWQPGSLFIDEERFGYIEPIFERHIRDFDHYRMVEVARDEWAPVLAELAALEHRLESPSDFSTIQPEIGFFSRNGEERFASDLANNLIQLRSMVRRLRTWIVTQLEAHETISVLGL